ncbi:MAG TPA: hypothetical protein DCE41_25220 [Cytophagales bacterium]|nr:hypothetical protein [Cytophagales bacterium]HAA24214.1 hypothetical protein [Cytophagales bacterium]HAP59171.1 hypothetical protein [Cytophagales bacterium]
MKKQLLILAILVSSLSANAQGTRPRDIVDNLSLDGNEIAIQSSPRIISTARQEVTVEWQIPTRVLVNGSVLFLHLNYHYDNGIEFIDEIPVIKGRLGQVRKKNKNGEVDLVRQSGRMVYIQKTYTLELPDALLPGEIRYYWDIRPEFPRMFDYTSIEKVIAYGDVDYSELFQDADTLLYQNLALGDVDEVEDLSFVKLYSQPDAEHFNALALSYLLREQYDTAQTVTEDCFSLGLADGITFFLMSASSAQLGERDWFAFSLVQALVAYPGLDTVMDLSAYFKELNPDIDSVYTAVRSQDSLVLEAPSMLAQLRDARPELALPPNTLYQDLQAGKYISSMQQLSHTIRDGLLQGELLMPYYDRWYQRAHDSLKANPMDLVSPNALVPKSDRYVIVLGTGPELGASVAALKATGLYLPENILFPQLDTLNSSPEQIRRDFTQVLHNYKRALDGPSNQLLFVSLPIQMGEQKVLDDGYYLKYLNGLQTTQVLFVLNQSFEQQSAEPAYERYVSNQDTELPPIWIISLGESVNPAQTLTGQFLTVLNQAQSDQLDAFYLSQKINYYRYMNNRQIPNATFAPVRWPFEIEGHDAKWNRFVFSVQ